MENPSRKRIWRNEKRWTSNKAMPQNKSCPTATATKTAEVQKAQDNEHTSTREPHGGDCSLRHRGRQLVHSTRHHGRTQVPKEDLWELSRPPKLALATLSIRSNTAFFPEGKFCHDPFLSGYHEDVSSIRDGFTAWVKSDPETILRRHIVDMTRAYASFREAPARKHSPSSQGYHFSKDMPNRSTEQTKLSVYG